MSNNTFIGGIPEEICDYPDLEFLFLQHNPLGSTIPACFGNSSDSKLRDVEIGSNRLTGTIPASLGGLPGLEILDLLDNDLEGRIPTELGKLSSVRHLNLAHNLLTGSIPTELGYMSELRSLNLATNGLGGKIPTEFGAFHELEELQLEGNSHLSGSIPLDLCQSSKLAASSRHVGCEIECACCSDFADVCSSD